MSNNTNNKHFDVFLFNRDISAIWLLNHKLGMPPPTAVGYDDKNGLLYFGGSGSYLSAWKYNPHVNTDKQTLLSKRIVNKSIGIRSSMVQQLELFDYENMILNSVKSNQSLSSESNLDSNDDENIHLLVLFLSNGMLSIIHPTTLVTIFEIGSSYTFFGTTNSQSPITSVDLFAVRPFETLDVRNKIKQKTRASRKNSNSNYDFISNNLDTTLLRNSLDKNTLQDTNSMNDKDSLIFLVTGHKRAIWFHAVKDWTLEGVHKIEPVLSLSLPESPKSLYWLDFNSVIVGTKNSIYLVNTNGQYRTIYLHPLSGFMGKLKDTKIGVLATPIAPSKNILNPSTRFIITKENITYLTKFKYSKDSNYNKFGKELTLLGKSKQLKINSSESIYSRRSQKSTIFSNQDQALNVDPSTKIDWKFPPTDVIHAPPFIIGVFTDAFSNVNSINRPCSIEIRSEYDGKLLQSINVPHLTGFNQLGYYSNRSFYINSNPQLKHDLSFLEKGFLVVGKNGIHIMLSSNMDDIVNQLCESHWYMTASNIVRTLPLDKELKRERVLNIQLSYAEFIFKVLHKYHLAMDVYLRYHAHPSTVLSLYPEFQNNEFFNKVENSLKNENIDISLTLDTKIEVNKFKKNTELVDEDSPCGEHSVDERNVSNSSLYTNNSNLVKSSKEAILVLMKYLCAERLAINELRQDNLLSNNMDNYHNNSDRNFDVNSEISSVSGNTSFIHKKNSTIGSIFTVKTNGLGYTNFNKSKLRNIVELNELSTIIDTALLKVYLIVRPALIKPLLRVENYCDVSECSKLLRDRDMIEELALLYKSNGQHETALGLLIDKWEDCNSNLNLKLKYKENIIIYLSSLDFESNVDLIFKYTKILMDIESKLKSFMDKKFKFFKNYFEKLSFVEIFTRNYQSLVIPTEIKIIEFLFNIKPTYAIIYCEYLFNEKLVNDIAIRNNYVIIYSKYLLSNHKSFDSTLSTINVLNSINMDEEETNYNENNDFGLDTIKRRKLYLKYIKEKEIDTVSLLNHIELYTSENKIEKNIFYRNLISTIYAKLKKYKESLDIYINDLDFGGANDFCESIYETKDKELSKIFDILFINYINHLSKLEKEIESFNSYKVSNNNNSKENLEILLNNKKRFLDIICGYIVKYMAQLTSSFVIKSLPEYFPMNLLVDYLTMNMGLLMETKNELIIKYSLLESRKLLLSYKKVDLESKYYIANEQSICGNCYKPLNNANFSVTPQGTFLHRYCT